MRPRAINDRPYGGETTFSVKVLPTFRPDKALGLEKPDYLDYLTRLGSPQSF